MMLRCHGGLCVGLNAVELDEVITEIKLLWPECCMVRGSPHHSPSNGEWKGLTIRWKRNWVHGWPRRVTPIGRLVVV
jgi:hypothetical protein